MQLMSKMSCGIIYSVKRIKGATNYDKISHFLSKYTDTPIEHYNLEIIQNALIRAIGELLNCMQYPSSFWADYNRLKNFPWSMNDFEAMCCAASNVQVKEKNQDNSYNYINGFSPVEDFNL